MLGNLQQLFRSQWQAMTFTKWGKLLLAISLAAPVAVILTIVGSCEFYMSQAVSSCNCMAEKMVIARTAFERNHQLTAFMFPVVDLAIALPLFLLPWTRLRMLIVLGALLATFIAWQSYPQYVALLPYNSSERWWTHPVSSVTAGPYSDIAREFIAPFLEWRSGCCLFAFVCAYIIGEVVSLGLSLGRKRLNSSKVAAASGSEIAVDPSVSFDS